MRAFTQYGVALNTECHIIYHGIPIYMRSLKNWQDFMTKHTKLEAIYHEGYKTFLNKTVAKINSAESILTKAEIAEWKKEYTNALKKVKTTTDNSTYSYLKKLIKRVLKILRR